MKVVKFAQIVTAPGWDAITAVGQVGNVVLVVPRVNVKCVTVEKDAQSAMAQVLKFAALAEALVSAPIVMVWGLFWALNVQDAMAIQNAPNAMEKERLAKSVGIVMDLKTVINVEVAEFARLVMAPQRVLYVVVMGIVCRVVVLVLVVHVKVLAKEI